MLSLAPAAVVRDRTVDPADASREDPSEKTGEAADDAARSGTRSGPWRPARHAAHRSWQHQQVLHARPAAMVAAFVITVVMAGGLLTLSLLWVAIASLSPEFLRSVLEQQPDMFDEA